MQHRILNGLRTKTINVRVTAGSTKFYLQQNDNLGLPKNALMVGILCRAHDDSITASNRQKLVKKTVFENSYLNLKVIEPGGINLLCGNYHLVDAVTRALLFEPTISKNIDWNESFIQINKRALPDVVTGQQIEMVVLYAEMDPQYIFTMPIKFELNVGEKLNGIRRQHIERPINTVENIYPLATTTNIGLPQNAWIIGFSMKQGNDPLFGDVMVSDTIKSTYLNLKRGTDSFVEFIPTALINYQITLFPFLDYIPIEPIPVLNVDWMSSNFQINDLTFAADTQVFQFDLFWVNGLDRLNTVE